jgi:hypothetical protein
MRAHGAIASVNPARPSTVADLPFGDACGVP